MRGYGAGGEELVDQGLGAVPSCAGDVGGSRSMRKRVGIVAEKVSQVKGIGDWFGDGDGSGGCGLQEISRRGFASGSQGDV